MTLAHIQMPEHRHVLVFVSDSETWCHTRKLDPAKHIWYCDHYAYHLHFRLRLGVKDRTGKFNDYVDPGFPAVARDASGKIITLDGILVETGLVDLSRDLLTRASVPKVVIPDDPPFPRELNWGMHTAKFPLEELHEMIKDKESHKTGWELGEEEHSV